MPWIRWVSSLLECLAWSGSVKSRLCFVRVGRCCWHVVDKTWLGVSENDYRECSPGIILIKLFLSLCLSFLEDDWQLCWLAGKRNIICYKKKKKGNLVNGLLERKCRLWYLHSHNSLSSGVCITNFYYIKLTKWCDTNHKETFKYSFIQWLKPTNYIYCHINL